jgi:hypothetical protein
LGGWLIYKLKVFLGCQRIFDPIVTQTLEGRRSKKKKNILYRWKRDMYLIKNMMVVA